MRFIRESKFRILLIFITMLCSLPLFGQERYAFVTPKIDSICRNTLEYVRIKNSLLRRQYQIEQDMQQLELTINELSQQHLEIIGEKDDIENELATINRYFDSLKPHRPDGPRPKTHIIDIINEGLTFHGSYGLNINQLALSNWAAGGENSATGKAFANFTLIDQRKLYEQKLVGAFAFGLSRFADKRIEKSDDKIDLTYTFLLHGKKQLKFSAVATFNTQFANGYKYPNDSTVISGFFAPANLTVSVGCTYKARNERFQIYVSPLAGKEVFVLIQELADQGAFGVEKGYYDQDSVWIPGKRQVAAIGTNIIVNYNQPIGRNITYSTVFNFFYNYTEVRHDDRVKIDFNWENTMKFVISKHLSTILFVHLKYDHNTTFPVYQTIDGVETVVDNIPKLQLKESLGIAFVHNF